MKVKPFLPLNPLLKNYIECIYILTHTSEEKPVRYLTFPSIHTIVTISEKSKTIDEGGSLNIKPDQNNDLESNIVFNFNKPVYVKYEGEINEITIYFKPLAINSFLDKDLNYFNKTNFSGFLPFEDYKKTMIEILSLKEDRKKIEALESYWISKLKGFQHDFLNGVINEMSNAENDVITISEICRKNHISRTTLNKHFDKHICKTPSQFKKILRFRNAVKKYTSNDSQNKLTDTALYINYFDQSHMIREFKSLTGFSPKHFFNETTEIEKKEIRWQFL